MQRYNILCGTDTTRMLKYDILAEKTTKKRNILLAFLVSVQEKSHFFKKNCSMPKRLLKAIVAILLIVNDL